METNRQKKISSLLQKDIAKILQNRLKERGTTHILISVTAVKVSVDLSIAKVYVSIYPSNKQAQIIQEIEESQSQIKHQLATLTRNQMRKMPALRFFVDDTFAQIEAINQAITNPDNPIAPSYLSEKENKSENK